MGLSPLATGAGNASTPAPAGSRVALLAPLTGPNAGVAQGIVNSAKLGLGQAGASLDVIDTGSTPQGAAAAAQKAIADGAGLIIGPLTAGEAAAVAPITQPAHVVVLALTSDPAQAKPGVWTLGITPAQQVHALIQAATAQGHGQVAGLLPESPLGMAMSQALQQETGASGSSASIQTYSGGSFSSMNGAVRTLSNYAGRRGPVEAQIKQLRTAHTAAGRQQAARLERQGVPAAPFSALLVAENASGLGELSSLLPYYDINIGPVLILGPGIWAGNPGAIAAAGFSGALYAAPDPAAATQFISAYSAAYGGPPSPLDGLAFDAGAIARVTTAGGHLDTAALTNPQGFTGADGVLLLLPNGSVKRGLAVFKVQPGGAEIAQPAPQSLATPGS